MKYIKTSVNQVNTAKAIWLTCWYIKHNIKKTKGSLPGFCDQRTRRKPKTPITIHSATQIHSVIWLNIFAMWWGWFWGFFWVHFVENWYF